MEKITQTLRESKWGRWAALIMVSFTMLCSYFLTDAMAPMQSFLQKSGYNMGGQAYLNWTASDYGFFTGAYGWFNVFLLMLIVGGIILDKMGVRFTGILAISIMILGAFIKWFAISGHYADQTIINLHFVEVKKQVLLAGLGFACFGVGCEMFGITANKAVIRWFKGKEMALAIGLNTSVGRIGTALAMILPIHIYNVHQRVSDVILVALFLLCLGLLAFICFSIFDKKLDGQEAKLSINDEVVEEEGFKISDIGKIASIRAFWYVAALCVLFYSAVFPFIKYATMMMSQKFHLPPALAGYLPALLPIGSLLLTPLFGSVYDKKGKGATIMIIGSIILVCVHLMFAFLPFDSFPSGLVIPTAVGLIVLLGIGFSMVPSAMWPSVAKIIPEQRLGTAYAMTFWIQNWGLMLVPMLIGSVLDKYCHIYDLAGNALTDAVTGAPLYNFRYPFLIFASFGVIAIMMAFLLKAEDKRMGFGLEKPNEIDAEVKEEN